VVDMRPRPKPALVLLPGLDGTGAMFARFRRALAPAIRTIVVSYPPDQAIGYAGLEGFVRPLLPRDDPFVLLAESFSGPIGIAIAASRPAGLRGLILVSSFARNPHPPLAPLRPLVRLLPILTGPAALLTRHALGRFATAALLSELSEALSRVSPSVVRSRLRAILDVDASALLPRVDVPVLYLQASDDRVVPRSASAVLERVPQIRFTEVEGPHFVLQASPSVAARHIEAFVRMVATP
jgi:pimeloyl-[acyl-carrier protein] methyl ester esterase